MQPQSDRRAATSSRSTATPPTATRSARARADVALAPRRRHLRAARRAGPRRRGRHGLLRRLEQDRRLAALAARPRRERVLLRAPLGVLAVRAQQRAGARRHRARLRRQHRRRRGDAVPPALRDPSRSRCSASATTARSIRRRTSTRGSGCRTSASARRARGSRASCGSRASRAPEPGAILLQISDISSASGLDPGSLRRALAPVAAGRRCARRRFEPVGERECRRSRPRLSPARPSRRRPGSRT